MVGQLRVSETRGWLAAALGVAVASLVGCPSDSYDDDDDDTPGDGSYDDDDTPPPEEEDDFLSSEPRGTDVFVFVANPDRDTVSRIDAFTREVQTIDVGDEPVQVVVSADYQRAVTFNAGEDTVSVIDVLSSDVVDLEVREDFNYIAISPDGRWVVAWFNAGLEDANFDIEGVRSFTEVSFVDTLALTVQSFSVGFNPKQVIFPIGSERAVVVSDTHLTVADLSGDSITLNLLDLGADPIDPPVAAEVEVPPGAHWAFVRYHGSNVIQAIDLDDGALVELDGGETPTDLDLSSDGGEVIVVSRGSQELRIFDAGDPGGSEPLILETPSDTIIGSLVLSPSGDQGLLFTTAAREDQVTLWDRATDEMHRHRLTKPIRAVAASPDGRSALIVHTLEDAEGEDDLFTDRFALTVVDLESWITNPVMLANRPRKWTTSIDGRYSLFIMEGDRNVGVIDYETRLVDDVTVPSQPVHIGMIPLDEGPEQALGWVSQQHDLGRISFVQPFDLSVQTVTGFELNGDID